MQFYLFNIRPEFHHQKWQKLHVTQSHSCELSQLHQQPVDAVLCPTFFWKLCYRLTNVVTFTFIWTFGQNFVFFTECSEWHHVDRQCDA